MSNVTNPVSLLLFYLNFTFLPKTVYFIGLEFYDYPVVFHN